MLAGEAVACTCAAAPARVRLDSADAAFIGRLVEVRDGPSREGAAWRRFVFLVDGRVKGDLPRRVEVLSPADSGACGFSVERNEASGILLNRVDGEWRGGLCGQIAVGELVAANAESDERLVNWGGILFGSVVLLVGGWLTWRRLRRRRAALAVRGNDGVAGGPRS